MIRAIAQLRYSGFSGRDEMARMRRVGDHAYGHSPVSSLAD